MRRTDEIDDVGASFARSSLPFVVLATAATTEIPVPRSKVTAEVASLSWLTAIHDHKSA
jgi:hypothetical protein